jgi:large subunit ribosomal protein L35Ae
MVAVAKKSKRVARVGKPTRLYAKAVVTGYTKGKSDQKPNHSILKIEGVNTKADTEFYLGKRVAYIYKAKSLKSDSKVRAVWGKITRHHGNSGSVQAKFTRNLPAKSFGASIRVMLFPSRI